MQKKKLLKDVAVSEASAFVLNFLCFFILAEMMKKINKAKKKTKSIAVFLWKLSIIYYF